ncbi:hypothetical protein CJF42_25295 [Pseudoalteromonas sp. NBT06-2]|uniref:helix-turn-helix domain-containing protein n=1 Tax=Pseudoalteromonas sp. NBT06-2 TaxID=2025950 RepID=UPI000BA6BDE7|nr:helix-turn-helix transcriptional regulator [Pseudoalteromonas sp. NBT06-2]PAJ71699.1 hypothetical protein CJF42_25295 [Pseudoalteromonas sp. NBT06-2]
MRKSIKNIFKQLNNDLPSHIKSMRIGAGYSQGQLAAKMPVNVSQATISNWEHGKTQVGFTEFITICIICGQAPSMYIPEPVPESEEQLNKESINDKRQHQ